MLKNLRSLLTLALLATVVSSSLAFDVTASQRQGKPPTAGVGKKPNKVDPSKQVEKALDVWLKAISTGTPTAVEKLYTKDAVLLPTLSPDIASTPAERHAYFTDFTAKPNLKGKATKKYIRVFGNTAVDSGLYTFTFTQKDKDTGKDVSVELKARFTYVYRKENGTWMIVQHHSSEVPKPH